MGAMTIRHGVSAVLVTIAASALLAACGGSGGGGGTGDQSDDSKQLAFAACLRKAGIDAPDPQRGADGDVKSQIRVPKSISPQRLEQIQRDCIRKTGWSPKPLSKEEEARNRDRALKFARCMRAHGVDIPDPQPTGGGIVVHGAPGGIDPRSPAFKRAQQACQSLMPGPKGRNGAVVRSAGSAGNR
jgi:hypothetical protein